MQKISYHRHQFPSEIIQHAVWLYFRFPLSYRDVEDLLAERGIEVSYETVRRWALKFGRAYARKLRRTRPRPNGRWHLDEVFVSINGKRMYLWRAVDSEGEVLDILVQSRRNKKAALKLMRKLLKKQGYAPTEVVTDKAGLPETLSLAATVRVVPLAPRPTRRFPYGRRTRRLLRWLLLVPDGTVVFWWRDEPLLDRGTCPLRPAREDGSGRPLAELRDGPGIDGLGWLGVGRGRLRRE